jgi:putative transposase
MLAAALQAEVAAYVEQFKDELDEHGRRLVVRNGFHAEREVTTAAGAMPVRAPRVNDQHVDEATGERKRFGSAILPAWARKSPRVAEVLPLLYLHGLSSSDFAPALTQFLGTSHGLSAATITRLKGLARRGDRVQQAVPGRHRLRVPVGRRDPPRGPPGAGQGCLLVMIGVRADGTKELVAFTDGHRESSESWADLLRDCKRRGMAAPVLAIGDGALGFWAALRHVFPATREQRCWFHKIANVSTRSPSPHSPARRPRWPRSGTPKTASTPRPLPAPSWPSTAPSGPKRSRRSPTTSTWRGRSSSSSPPSNGGVPSTHPTSSLSSGPEPGSRRASWSNVPTNQEAISKSHDTPIRRS